MASHVISIFAHINYAKHCATVYMKIYFKYLAGESVEYLLRDPQADSGCVRICVDVCKDEPEHEHQIFGNDKVFACCSYYLVLAKYEYV